MTPFRNETDRSGLGGALRRLAGPLLLAALAGVAGLAGEAGRLALRFDRAALPDEAWRFVTGHLVHLGPGHLLLNLAGLTAIVLLLRDRVLSPGWWLLVFLASAAAIDAGLLMFEPGLDWYVGLSGVLHGFWAAGAIALVTDGDRLTGWGLALLLLGKLVAEQLYGASEMTAALSGGDVVTAAHLYGAAGGVLGGVVLLLGRRRGP